MTPHQVCVAFLVAVVVLVCPMLVFAEDYIVVDIDGSVEGFAGLTTLLRTSSGPQLKLVTVSGTTWGFGSTATRNLCRFLNMAGRGNVEMALGAVASLDDQYLLSKKSGFCLDSQGFPATPQDAKNRNMPYSRADVTSSFSAANDLPHTATTVNCGYSTDAKKSLLALLLKMSTTDKLVYIAMGSTVTNLAKFMDTVEADRDAKKLMTLLRERASFHIYEPGYAGGADPSGMQVLLEYDLPILLYPPVFFSTAASFSTSYWNEFSSLASRASAAQMIQWIKKAWEGKRSLMGSDAFHKDSAPASSLVTLCAVDSVLQPLCDKYRVKATKLRFTLSPPLESSVSVAVDGGNVTVKGYYVLNETAGAAEAYVFSKSAAATAEDGSLLQTSFWDRWFALLS